MFLEQRQPAPHAVVSGWEADLRPAWSLDLAGEPGHDGLFSENRIIARGFPPTTGPALDRPRIRTVAGGLTALWIGRTDGARLWCNTGDRATALTYGLAPTHRTEPGVRLAFPERDPRGGDITVPPNAGRFDRAGMVGEALIVSAGSRSDAGAAGSRGRRARTPSRSTPRSRRRRP